MKPEDTTNTDTDTDTDIDTGTGATTGAATRIADVEAHTGEGILWHPSMQRLFWVDIPNGRLFSYNPRTREPALEYERDGAIGGFTMQTDGDLLLFEEDGRIETWNPGTRETTVVRAEIPEERGSRFNDVIADPLGGVFCGTMPQGDSPGRLYRLATDGDLTMVADDVGISNGLGFTPDLTGLYHTETTRDRIYRYEYDPVTGAVGDRTTFVDASAEPGHPDGLTVDAQGCVWSARWDGGRVVRYGADGGRRGEWQFPARKVSCVTFGGPAYQTAFVTTALAGSSRESEGAGAGAVFRFDPGVRGISEFTSAIRRGDVDI